MQVPLLDLKAQYATIRDDILAAIEPVLESQALCNGPAVRDLEAALADYSGCTEGIGVSSGTDALLAALMALDVGPGDEVICPPFTFFATAGCVRRTGATPVFVDIQADTFNIDPAKIASAITDKTRAIIPVHLFGQLADMPEILAVADARGLAVIEDAAQAIGAAGHGGKAGCFGKVGCFSFYPTKNLGGLGEGGMIVTRDAELAERLRFCRNHGMGTTYYHEFVGGNFRLDTIQAAGLLVKFRHLEEWSARRRANAARYDDLLADVADVTTPTVREGNTSIVNQYVIRARDRDALRAHLGDHGVSSGVYYPLGLHMQKCFADLGYAEGDFPVTEQACGEVLALPIYPELADEQIVYTAEQIKAFYA